MTETSSIKTEITVESSDPLVASLPDELKDFLESLWSMSLREDWNESDAQDLVTRGGELYEKYK
jgi:chemotaxis regulatin CheY-phosphate phosphatase CheZ